MTLFSSSTESAVSPGRSERVHRIQAQPLTRAAFAPYGSVIEPHGDTNGTYAEKVGRLPLINTVNWGTAERHEFVAECRAARPHTDALANMCIFRCRGQQFGEDADFQIKGLERHEFSTQTFVPMASVPKAAQYLVIVALSGDDNQPDLDTLKAFIARADQGISYHVGVWHHPMTACEHDMQFFCVVHETGRLDIDYEPTKWNTARAAVYI